MVKNPLATQKTLKPKVQSLSQEDALEEEMATHSSILAWKTPWREEPRGLQSMGSQRVRLHWATKQQRAFRPPQGICLLSCSAASDSDPMNGSLLAPLSVGIFRQEYWSGLPFPCQGIIPTQGSNLHLVCVCVCVCVVCIYNNPMHIFELLCRK